MEVRPLAGDDEPLYFLCDPVDPSASPVVVSAAALLLLSMLDGTCTVGEVRAAFLLRTGRGLTEREVRAFVDRLDDAGVLDSDRFRARRAEQVSSFRSAAERAAIHAGASYPAEADELRSLMDRFFIDEQGPGAGPAPPSGPPPRGLIAPHIDLQRGGPTYAWTYKALKERWSADIYVILGTCHAPMDSPLAATRKPYATPFGPAHTDQAFLDTLQDFYSGDLYEDEFSHRGEHSIEFQALYLRSLGLVGEPREASIVPLLCGALHQWVSPDEPPIRDGRVPEAINALRESITACGKRVCLVAGADLAHVGPQFGDRRALNSAAMESVAADDREMLERICSVDAESFYAQVMADGDARRICGLSPIYYLLALLGGGSGQVLNYSQWVDRGGHGAVTFAGVLFE